MQQFRRFVRGPVGKVLLAAIILPFVISGFYGYFAGGGGEQTVAKVEGSTITNSYLKARTLRLRQMIRQQNPDVTSAMLDSFVKPRMVLAGIINEQLVAAAADNADMVVSDAQAAKTIRANQAFQENGQFSQDKFQRVIRAQGMSPRSYLDGLRRDRVSQQFRAGFQATGFALPGELTALSQLINQTRSVRYAVLDASTLRDQEKVTDDQVKAWYQGHQDSFMRPKQYRVQYLALSPEQYAGKAKVSEEHIRKEYQARKAMRENASVQREVSDILVAINGQRDQEQAIARADKIRKELEAGGSFAKLAKQYSDDPSTADNGGDLGMLSKGALPPKLEATLDKLKVGEVSEPVVTDDAVHLLRITKQDQQTMPPLKDLHDEIAADLKTAEEKSLLSQAVNKLDQLAYEHTDLQEPAADLGLQVQTTDWTALDDLPDVLANDQVKQALQSHQVAEQGHNSDVLEVGQNQYVVVHLLGTQAPEVKPIGEVADTIRQQLKQQQAARQVEKIADQARKAVQDDQADMSAVAQLLDAKVQSKDDLQRHASELSAKLVSAVFSAPHPEDGKPAAIQFVTLADGDLAAFQVTAVSAGKIEATDQQRQQGLTRLAQMEGQQSYQEVMEYLHNTMDVTVHADHIKGGDQGPGNQDG